ncbi:MAG: tRNA dimethylallyltransferase [Gammaproteobacteria bacterium SG8_47]|nr:MAG: tRNA dimethylallyltransferase [Gammaproteobacteria bacterium SG8_47]
MSSGQSLPPAVLLMGPTAAGKTDLALALVERLGLEIVSVDSAMVYRGMDIGTAKPAAELRERYPHHLVDILDPVESYSAAHFRADALACMNEIARRGRVPLLVGGTMLYFRALQRGLAVLPSADAAVRARLEREALEHGLATLHQRLQAVDPEAARRIHPNDPQRLQRALEVFESTGTPLSEFLRRQQLPRADWHWVKLIVAPSDRATLRERIAARFQQMLEQGFVDEVQRLRRRPELDPSKPAVRAVGYRQVWQYLDGELDYGQMVERGVTATRQLAKRQLTWLRAEPAAQWFDSEARSLLDEVLKVMRGNYINCTGSVC